MTKPLSHSWRRNLRNPLTEDEIDHFHRLGYAGPFTLCSSEEMAPIRETIEKEILDSPPPPGRPTEQSRHLDSPAIWELCRSSAVGERMASLLGPNLILWRSHLFNKEPGQFFLFTERLLHHSEPNRSNLRRLGLAIRVTIPQVRVDHDRLFHGHRNIVLRGEDFMGLNRLTDPPA